MKNALVCSLLAATLLVPALLGNHACGAGDRYSMTLAPDVPGTTCEGRLIVFFLTPSHPGWRHEAPMDGPFYQSPQPLASMAVGPFAPGETLVLETADLVFPEGPERLSGPVRVQALLDIDTSTANHAAGPGNLYSDVVEVSLSPTAEDRVELVLRHRVAAPATPVDGANLKWVQQDSALLSAFYGKTVQQRAGVALPKGYLDPEQADRRWPVIFVVPGFGDREEGAAEYAIMLAMQGTEEVAPQAVYVVLDPESPFGHHGFVDSPNNGPRLTALVEEFIPYLESKFRLDPRPEARIVTGHSSGGWSSLWMQLNAPDTFGACWASAPDPVDFSAFQMSNLYEDESLYEDAEGHDQPSYRRQVGPDREEVEMTVREEAQAEFVLDPNGGSGQQWDAWEAMFSPRDPETGRPRPMFDARTGRIDREVVKAWSRFDITRQVQADWERYGPILTDRVRLVCGTLDSFYLNRAVAKLKSAIDTHHGEQEGPGYILLVDGATHNNIGNYTFARWNEEMRAYLKEESSPERRGMP